MMKGTFSVMQEAASFFIEGNEVGVLLCHGFLGTPQSMRDLGEGVAAYGCTVFCPRLPGHGTDYRDLESFTYKDWFQEVEQAYHELKKRCRVVYVVGQSMGGTLTLDLASKYQDIKGIFLLNPAIRIPAFERYREMDVEYVREEQPDIKRQDVVEITYDYTPVSAYHQLLDYMEVVRTKLPEVQCEVTCFQSLEDHVVPPWNTDYVLEHVGAKGKRSYPLHHSYHIASMDYELDDIIEAIAPMMIQDHRMYDHQIAK